MRNGNRLKARGHHMFRWLAEVATADASAAQGAALGFAWPFWHLATPVDRFPAPKKPGLVKMRTRVRANITTDKTVQCQIATRAGGGVGGFWADPPSTHI